MKYVVFFIITPLRLLNLGISYIIHGLIGLLMVDDREWLIKELQI